MWVVLALLSAVFAGATSILAKCGIKTTDSTVATAIRTCIVLLMSWLMVMLVGSWDELPAINAKTWIFLILSGLATGASWLCYFKALQIGDVHQVVAVDKSSTILTMFLAILFLHESITWLQAICIMFIALGTYLMIERTGESVASPRGRAWLVYAGLSAVFAALTSILAKVGIEGVESNLGTSIRTAIVLVMAWGMVWITRKAQTIRTISKRELGFICLSGLATGGSWLCYFKALQDGPASIVVPMDKLSVVVTMIFSYTELHEKLTAKSITGLGLIVAGTLGMLL